MTRPLLGTIGIAVISSARLVAATLTVGAFRAEMEATGNVRVNHGDQAFITAVKLSAPADARLETSEGELRLIGDGREFSLLLDESGPSFRIGGDWGMVKFHLAHAPLAGRELLRTRARRAWGYRSEYNEYAVIPASPTEPLVMPKAKAPSNWTGNLGGSGPSFIKLQMAGPNDVITVQAEENAKAEFFTEKTSRAYVVRLVGKAGELRNLIFSFTSLKEMATSLARPEKVDDSMPTLGPNILQKHNWDLEAVKDGKPVGWYCNTWDGAAMRISASTDDPYRGRNCVELKRLNDKGHARILIAGSRLELKTPATYLLTYRLRSAKSARSFASILAHDASGKEIQFKGGAFSFFDGFMETTRSKWVKQELLIPLKENEGINNITVICTGAEGDTIWVDDVTLHEVDTSRRVMTPEEKAYVPWRWVPQGMVPHLPERVRVPGNPENLIRNGSFEAGVDRIISKRYAEVDTTTSVHGRASLLVRRRLTGVFAWGYDETAFFQVTPGKLHTMSFHAKTESPEKMITVRILSSFRAHAGRWDSDPRPGLSVSFPADDQWRRYVISFIPEKTMKDMASVLFHHAGSALSASHGTWVDALQVQEGPPTEFKLRTPLQVSVTPVQNPEMFDFTDVMPRNIRKQYPEDFRFRMRWARDFTWVDDESAPIKMTIWQEHPARKIKATYRLIDIYGREVRTITRKIRTSGKQYVEDTFNIKGMGMGSYLIKTEVTDGKDVAYPEQTLFAKIPGSLNTDELHDPPVFSYLAMLPHQARSHHRFGFRFVRSVPGWLDYCTTWRAVQYGSPDQWLWNDAAVEWTRKAGYEIFLNLIGFGREPYWAKKKVNKAAFPAKSCEKAFGFHQAEFMAYVEKIVDRYKGRVKYWEIMNEPYWGDNSAEAYASILRECSAIIRKADPDARIIAPSTYYAIPFYGEWTERVLKNAGTQYFDIFSYHGYHGDYLGSGSLEDGLANLNRLMDEYGGRRPMWDSEYNLGTETRYTDHLYAICNMKYPNNGPLYYGSSRDHPRAIGTAQYYLIGMAAGTELFHYHDNWNSFMRFPSVACGGDCWQHDGAPGNSLLAMATTARLFSGSKYLETLKYGNIARGYFFRTRQGDPIVGLFGVGMEKPVRLLIPLDPKKVEVVGLIGTKLWPNRDKEPLVRARGKQLELDFSRSVVYVTSSSIDEDDFLGAVKNMRISGARFSEASASIINAEGRAVLAGSVRNIGSLDPIRATIKAIVPEESAWEFAGERKTAATPMDEEMVGIVEALGIPGRPGRSEVIASVTVKGKPEFRQRIPVLVIPRLSKSIELDGRLDDWRGVPSYTLDRKDQVIYFSSRRVEWKGKEDMSVDVRLAWDKAFLYYSADVTDDLIRKDVVPKPTRMRDHWYLKDCVELFFDVSNRASVDRAGPGLDGRIQVLMVPATKGGEAAWMNVDHLPTKLKGLDLAVDLRPGGYVMEVRVPLSNFPSARAEPGSVIRFDTALNDSDGDPASSKFQSAKKIMSLSGNENSSRDSTGFFSVVLGQ